MTFWKVNLIKTKTRNRLKTRTVRSLLIVKGGVKSSGGCVSFSPSPELERRMTSNILYTNEDDDEDQTQNNKLFHHVSYNNYYYYILLLCTVHNNTLLLLDQYCTDTLLLLLDQYCTDTLLLLLDQYCTDTLFIIIIRPVLHYYYYWLLLKVYGNLLKIYGQFTVCCCINFWLQNINFLGRVHKLLATYLATLIITCSGSPLKMFYIRLVIINFTKQQSRRI